MIRTSPCRDASVKRMISNDGSNTARIAGDKSAFFVSSNATLCPGSHKKLFLDFKRSQRGDVKDARLGINFSNWLVKTRNDLNLVKLEGMANPWIASTLVESA